MKTPRVTPYTYAYRQTHLGHSSMDQIPNRLLIIDDETAIWSANSPLS